MDVLIFLGTDNDIENFLEQSQIFKCHFLQTITYITNNTIYYFLYINIYTLLLLTITYIYLFSQAVIDRY